MLIPLYFLSMLVVCLTFIGHYEVLTTLTKYGKAFKLVLSLVTSLIFLNFLRYIFIALGIGTLLLGVAVIYVLLRRTTTGSGKTRVYR